MWPRASKWAAFFGRTACRSVYRGCRQCAVCVGRARGRWKVLVSPFWVNRASVYRHTSKFKETPRWRQKNDPNSKYILVVRPDQRFQSSGPETYPRASRKAPPATFADEPYALPNYTSDLRRHPPSTWYIISTPAQFSYKLDGTGADGPRSEGGRRILLDNSRVYVRFLPFVSGRVHLGRMSTYSSILRAPLEPRETTNPRPHVYLRKSTKPKPAIISDATTQMDHNAVVLFTIDRLARSPRTTVRTRGTELAPDR